jgi:thymidylate synthase
MYGKFFNALDRGKKAGTWGTYAERMMAHPAKDGLNTINPLNLLVEKLRANGKSRQRFKSAYELNLSDPEVDLAPIMDVFGDGGDVPTYKAAFDAKATRNRPCLSHVSFKLVDTNQVNLTAIYRSHHYCARALGNLVGLARLLTFVAKESELEVGQMTCISTFATLDASTWGGVAPTRKLLGAYKPD